MNICKTFFFILLIGVALMACTKGKRYKCKVISTDFSSVDNSGATPIVPATDSVAVAAYAIKAEYAAVIVSGDDGFDDKYETEYSVENSIVNLRIYSLTDFDATHPALALLNDYFNLVTTTPSYKSTPLSTGFINPDFAFKDKKSDADTFRVANYFTLMHRPLALGSRAFVVTATRVDSTTITDTLHVSLF